MGVKYSSFYHLHIAKCGGTYLDNVLLKPLRDELLATDISYIDGSEHLGWKELEANYKVCGFRDPVKRTVSHYSFWRKGAGVNGRRPENPLDFLDWVDRHKSFISNYQVKNLLFSRTNFNYDIFQPIGSLDPNFAAIRINEALLLERLSKINVVLKDTQLRPDCLSLVHKKIKSDLGITSQSTITSDFSQDNKVLKESYALYQTLSPTDKKYLYELNRADSEVYFTSDFYFNKGVC
jgi:hypothetical protein